MPALLLGRSRLWLSVVRRFGCPRHYLGRIRLRLGVVRRFGCLRHYLDRAVWDWALCDDTVVRYRLPAHAWAGRCTGFGCPRHYLGRARLWLGVVPLFGCLRHYLGRARLGPGIVRRYGCSRYRLPAHVLGLSVVCGGSVACATTLAAHVLDCALFRDSVARADTWLHALSQTVLCAFHTRAPKFDLMPGRPAAPAPCARPAFQLFNAPPC